MNILIHREFLPIKEGHTRKRWFATMQCQQCSKIFTIREQLKNAHLLKPCESCAKKNIAYRKFLDKSIAKHKQRFDYSLITKENYVNLFTPVPILCKQHGLFYQKPKDHTSNVNGKQCCPTCIHEFNKVHNKRSIESWKKELENKAPHICMKEHKNADSNTEQCTLSCKHHGEFTTTLARIKAGTLICPKCVSELNSWNTRSKREDTPGIVYFIYIPDIDHYKFGVTTTSVQQRLSALPHKYEIICTLNLPTAKAAYALETAMFREFQQFRPYSKYVKPTSFSCFGGYTELLNSQLPTERFITEMLCRKESNSEELPPSNVEDNSERSLGTLLGTCND